MSDEAGPYEVYVMPLAEAAAGGAFQKTEAGKWQISTSGGTFPRWRRDGNELFYLSAENTLVAVTVNGQGSAFEVGAEQSPVRDPPSTREIPGYLSRQL
jgi:eukaryotic-like serine/threonine-protein kinase